MVSAELMDALVSSGAVLYLDDAGTLRYQGPKLATDDPIRQAIAANRAELVELFTYAPGRRCVFTGCFSLIHPGSKIVCADHQRDLDAISPICERCGLPVSHAPLCEGQDS